jgi:CRAL/TRIO domain
MESCCSKKQKRPGGLENTGKIAYCIPHTACCSIAGLHFAFCVLRVFTVAILLFLFVVLLLQEIFATLSELDKETAARTSWQYYLDQESSRDNGTGLLGRRDALARAMIQRHLVGEGGDVTTAGTRVHATLQGRREQKLDWVRTAWHHQDTTTWSLEQIEFSQSVRSKMSRWLGPHGRVCILDYDDEDRCNFYHRLNISTFGTRYFREGILYAASYMLEKAIACSERRSHGRQTQVNVILDFREVNMRDKDKTLPISIALEIVDLLKNHYPQRLYTITMIDAPFLARLAWPIFRPFVNHIVQGGIHFVTGKRQILKVFGPKMCYYDRASNLDMDKFYQLPFDHSYEDVHGHELEY